MEWRDTPPLAALRAFSVFAQTGGVQQAGAALNVSHAAISQQLKALEDHLGVALLDRSQRALGLTDAGQVLAAGLSEGFDRIHQVLDDVTAREAGRAVYVSTTSSFAGSWLIPRLAEFRAVHPNIDLMIDPTPKLVPLGPGGADVAIRFGSGAWTGMDASLIARGGICVVATPDLVEGRFQGQVKN